MEEGKEGEGEGIRMDRGMGDDGGRDGGIKRYGTERRKRRRGTGKESVKKPIT